MSENKHDDGRDAIAAAELAQGPDQNLAAVTALRDVLALVRDCGLDVPRSRSRIEAAVASVRSGDQTHESVEILAAAAEVAAQVSERYERIRRVADLADGSGRRRRSVNAWDEAARLAEHRDNFKAIARVRDVAVTMGGDPIVTVHANAADLARVLDLAHVGASLLTHASEPFHAHVLAQRALTVFLASKPDQKPSAAWEQVAAELYRIGYLAQELHRAKRREGVADIVTGAGATTAKAKAEAAAMGQIFVQTVTAALMAVAHAAAETGSKILSESPHAVGSVPTADAMMLFAETAKVAAETMAADAAAAQAQAKGGAT